MMIEHSPVAFTHEEFVNIIQKVTNPNLYYKGILFYLDEEPTLINDLLRVLSAKLDHDKLIKYMRQTE